MTAVDLLERARGAYEQRAWEDAYDHLSTADERASLGAEDLERYGMAAYLIGRVEVAEAVQERAHRAYLELGETTRAVRCAFWLGLTLFLRGQLARGGGWMARAQRALDEAAVDCVERGYLMLPAALQALNSGDPATAYATFAAIGEIADRFGDPDLVAFSSLGRGQALVAMGKATEGVGMLDDAMLTVTTDNVSPVAAGIVYCAVIIACRDIFDVRRAQEWTAALSRWCAAQQELKPYRGQCLVHRSELMQLRGDWPDALEEAQQACAHLADPPGDPVLGMAMYQQAELLRLRGEYAQAEHSYRQASDCGHEVHPGLALLRLAQGRHADATGAIRRVLDETNETVQRSRVLGAYVEIMISGGEIDAARTAADELTKIAAEFESPYLRAVAGYAHGSVLLAAGDSAAACAVLRRAWADWRELQAPYEAARVRMLMGRACQQLEDHDTAEMELDAARHVFEELGAVPALSRVLELSRRPPQTAGGLTTRELEVLRLVATGATNREIADTLVISDKTVARHLSNMFTKLGVSSRAAATAYAYEHDLV